MRVTCDELFIESAFIDNIIDTRAGNYMKAGVSRLKMQASSRKLISWRMILSVLLMKPLVNILF